MTAHSQNTRIISMNGGFVFNAVCDFCTTVIPAEDGLKEKLEAAFSESGLIQYHLHESDGLIQIDAKGVSAHASMPALGVNAAGVTFACLAKAGFEDDFVRFYNSHIGTACDGSGLDLKFQDAYGDLTLCNGIVKTENGEISCTIDIRFPVTLSTEQICTMCQNRLEDSDGYIEIQNLTEPLFFPRESPLVESLYKAYTDVTGDTANEPLVIGGGTYAKSLKISLHSVLKNRGWIIISTEQMNFFLSRKWKKLFLFIWKQSKICSPFNKGSIFLINGG